jgi:hypothetical protein
MLVPNAKPKERTAEFSEDVLVNESYPLKFNKLCSIGPVISVSTSSVDAPGYTTWMNTDGKLISGNVCCLICVEEYNPYPRTRTHKITTATPFFKLNLLIPLI